MTGARAARLVHRARQPEHAAAGGRARRLRLRLRLLRRRPAVLDRGRTSSRRRKPHLIVPYTLDANDMRFATPQGFNTGDAVLRPICRTRSTCCTRRARRRAEDDVGSACTPPARAAGPLRRAAAVPRPRARSTTASGSPAHRHRAALEGAPSMAEASVIDLAGLNALDREAVRPHAGRDLRAFAVGRGARSPSVRSRASTRCTRRCAPRSPRRARRATRADPRPSEARRQGRDPGRDDRASKREQSGAGLSQCSPEEYAQLHALNDRYEARFGFPFILAVRGHTRASILRSSRGAARPRARRRDRAKSLRQIARIAKFRLGDRIGRGS